MKELWKIYHHEIPGFLLEFMNTKEMLRLKDIGMNCGCEYTSFPVFQKCQRYSRFDHSVGVALIIYHFTSDMKQSIAGLVHDIASPVFAHTIDFLNGDYIKQESTESETESMIRNSVEINRLLKKYQLCVEDICNYHHYPIADNESPKLSSDRLEYSLGNMLNYGFVSKETIRQYYQHLYVHHIKQELAFDNLDMAISFTKDVLKTSKVYICDEDRFAMKKLAMILKEAIEDQVIHEQDLYTNETVVIQKLCQNQKYCIKWYEFRKYSYIERYSMHIEGSYCVQAKKRYILPLYKDTRIDLISKDICDLIAEFCHISFDYYIQGKS
ncbi:MAG: HD domain-containing protein [Faecalibacillus sp.]